MDQYVRCKKRSARFITSSRRLMTCACTGVACRAWVVFAPAARARAPNGRPATCQSSRRDAAIGRRRSVDRDRKCAPRVEHKTPTKTLRRGCFRRRPCP